mmetsp:Transcript_42113/g.54237  ORF Transcript_42113/g.54237 Transcript_42113/m.54237 type:complete len:564 (-) Transcript_42113:264-1955(-)
MAHNMHYVMEKWLVQSLDVFTCDLNLCWLVLETYLATNPRPRLKQVRDTVVPMFLAIMDDDDEIDADNIEINTQRASHWHKYQNDALKKIALEELNEEGIPGKRDLARYRFRDHLKVAFRSSFENLVVFPFWAVKVAAISGGGRLDSLRPYPFAIGWYGCFQNIHREEGFRGLIKGALPMVIIGVSQALVIARQRHITFMRLVENSVEKAKTKQAMIKNTSSVSLNRTAIRSSQHGSYGSTCDGSNPTSASLKKRNAPWQYMTELTRAVIRHPFELLGVRMVTSNAPEYSSCFSALYYHFSNNDLMSLFVGIRQSLFNGVFLPKQSQQFMFLGIPTILRIRRMLALPSNRPNFNAHAGLGGSVKLLTDMLKEDGMMGLLSCARVTFDIALPAALSILAARAIGYLLVGSTREQAIKTEIRKAYLKEMFNKKRGSGNSSMKRRSLSRNNLNDSSSNSLSHSNSTSYLFESPNESQNTLTPIPQSPLSRTSSSTSSSSTDPKSPTPISNSNSFKTTNKNQTITNFDNFEMVGNNNNLSLSQNKESTSSPQRTLNSVQSEDGFFIE